MSTALTVIVVALGCTALYLLFRTTSVAADLEERYGNLANPHDVIETYLTVYFSGRTAVIVTAVFDLVVLWLISFYGALSDLVFAQIVCAVLLAREAVVLEGKRRFYVSRLNWLERQV